MTTNQYICPKTDACLLGPFLYDQSKACCCHGKSHYRDKTCNDEVHHPNLVCPKCVPVNFVTVFDERPLDEL